MASGYVTWLLSPAADDLFFLLRRHGRQGEFTRNICDTGDWRFWVAIGRTATSASSARHRTNGCHGLRAGVRRRRWARGLCPTRPITTPRWGFLRAQPIPTIPFRARQTALLLMPPVVVPSWFAVIGILSCRLPGDNLSDSIYWALRDGGSIPHGTLQYSARFAPLL